MHHGCSILCELGRCILESAFLVVLCRQDNLAGLIAQETAFQKSLWFYALEPAVGGIQLSSQCNVLDFYLMALMPSMVISPYLQLVVTMARLNI